MQGVGGLMESNELEALCSYGGEFFITVPDAGTPAGEASLEIERKHIGTRRRRLTEANIPKRLHN